MTTMNAGTIRVNQNGQAVHIVSSFRSKSYGLCFVGVSNGTRANYDKQGHVISGQGSDLRPVTSPKYTLSRRCKAILKNLKGLFS